MVEVVLEIQKNQCSGSEWGSNRCHYLERNSRQGTDGQSFQI